MKFIRIIILYSVFYVKALKYLKNFLLCGKIKLGDINDGFLFDKTL